jgi:WD40 repeat protein
MAYNKRDHTVQLWDASTRAPTGAVLQLPGSPKPAAISPDGRTILISFYRKNTAQLYNVATGEAIGPPLQHKRHVTSVAFSPDGRAVLTGSTDQTARLYDAATGKPIGPPLRHPGTVDLVAFSADGRSILTQSKSTVRIYPGPTPVTGDVERIVLWAGVMTGMELTSGGEVRILDPETWKKRSRQLGEPTVLPHPAEKGPE